MNRSFSWRSGRIEAAVRTVFDLLPGDRLFEGVTRLLLENLQQRIVFVTCAAAGSRFTCDAYRLRSPFHESHRKVPNDVRLDVHDMSRRRWWD